MTVKLTKTTSPPIQSAVRVNAERLDRKCAKMDARLIRVRPTDRVRLLIYATVRRGL